ncbi:unnamed protein product [Clonostachys rhizophaga]|uniref:Uncharacterized protein n=1 Tax=Clonostachys rhizophaga TaxID=160324 RepID=A0A9N9VR82_9HYPO|nr:unnamed protein product [Clonostachys rhizophaga]
MSSAVVPTTARLASGLSDLPRDIRDCIWDSAAANFNNTPQAHFFSLSEERVRCLQSNQPTIQPDGWKEARTVLKPPLVYREEVAINGKTARNISGYMVYHNLWNTSIESREAIIRQWNQWREHCPDECAYTFMHIGDSPALAVALRPANDLIYLEIPETVAVCRNINCAAINVGSRARNFAFTYDPNWYEEIETLLPRLKSPCETSLVQDGTTPGCRFLDLATRLLCDPNAGTYKRYYDDGYDSTFDPRMNQLWLIDPTLKPSAHFEITKVGRDRVVFDACGSKYIEVRLDSDIGKEGWWEISNGYSPDCTAKRFNSMLCRGFNAFWMYNEDPFGCDLVWM